MEIPRRTAPSIRFMHSNISAVLREMGSGWNWGHKPVPNYSARREGGTARLRALVCFGPAAVAGSASASRQQLAPSAPQCASYSQARPDCLQTLLNFSRCKPAPCALRQTTQGGG